MNDPHLSAASLPFVRRGSRLRPSRFRIVVDGKVDRLQHAFEKPPLVGPTVTHASALPNGVCKKLRRIRPTHLRSDLGSSDNSSPG